MPNEALSAFDGEDLAGNWRLDISDSVGADTGTLDEWCLLPATAATVTDSDGDGVTDDVDNCTLAANADQRDTNGDGFGNACDADLDNNGIINFLDLGIIKSTFFTGDPDSDLNGDGAVDFIDLGVMRGILLRCPRAQRIGALGNFEQAIWIRCPAEARIPDSPMEPPRTGPIPVPGWRWSSLTTRCGNSVTGERGRDK